MKTRINTLHGAVLALLVLTVTANAATQVFDLKTDWSDTQNPNGAWSYRRAEDGSLLPSDPFPWVVNDDGVGLVGIARATEAFVVPGSLELGDIFVMPKEPGLGGVTVRWTAPANGTINVSGNSWGCAGFDWALKHNGNDLSSGKTWGTSNTRDLPYQFSSGSGGATALQNITVQAGDQVEIVVSTFLLCDSPPDSLNITITLTADTVDPIAAIENLAIAVFEMNLQNGIENSLDSKLDAAINALIDANFNNDGAACNSLEAFISAVEAQRGIKITSAQADQLIASAQQIQASLNCGN